MNKERVLYLCLQREILPTYLQPWLSSLPYTPLTQITITKASCKQAGINKEEECSEWFAGMDVDPVICDRRMWWWLQQWLDLLLIHFFEYTQVFDFV